MEIDNSCSNTQYYCAICNTTPDQISHHKAHIKTQKHIYKKKCFENCINMNIFYFQKMSKEEIIEKFEEETGTKFVAGDVVRDWRFNKMNSLDDILKIEFPKVVIPAAQEDIIGTPNFLDKWLEIIIDTNETVIVKIKKNKNTININSFKDKTIEELIHNAIQTKSEFDITLVFYKLLSEKYLFKSFIGNVWIDKTNISLSVNDVAKNIRNEINTTLKDAFVNFSKTLEEDSQQFKICLKLIEQFNKTNFKNNILKEAKEIFFECNK